MRIFTTLSFILIILALGCANRKSKSLENHSIITEIYTQEEIEDLKKVMIFFESRICESKVFSLKDTYKCYDDYLFGIKKKIKDEDINFNFLAIDDLEKLQEIIGDKSFNQIWNYKIVKEKNNEIILVNNKGKYMEFLNKYSEDNKKIQSYYNLLKSSSGYISPSIIFDIFINKNYYNLNDERDKLLIAIHCLTANKQVNLNKKNRLK